MTIARWLGPALLLVASALSGCTSSDENDHTGETDTDTGAAQQDTAQGLTARPPTTTPPKAVVPSFTGNPVTSF